MTDKNTPKIFEFLLSNTNIEKPDILKTSDGFYMVNRSISNILSSKDVFDFPDSSGERLACSKFFDDLVVPEHYKEIVQQSISYKNSAKLRVMINEVETYNQLEELLYKVCGKP